MKIPFQKIGFPLLMAIALTLMGCGTEKNQNKTVPVEKKIESLYQCPMHPQIIKKQPGNCPICGMSLVAINKPHDSSNQTVHIDPTMVQKMGVRTESVHRRVIASELRLDGKVMPDESRIVSVTSRVAGYVETLQASVTGQEIHQGQTLMEIYSPDLMTAQTEYIQAIQYREGLNDSISPLRENANQLVESAKRRLLNWNVPGSVLNQLEKTKIAVRRIPLSAPISGVIMRKQVTLGQSIEPGLELFQIVDLSQIWITARVYQADMAIARVGAKALLRFRNLPQHEFHSTISFISPEMDPATRTVEIRMTLPNTLARDLKPEMFAELFLKDRKTDSVIAIPEQSIIRTGSRTLVIVALGEGRFTPKEIRLGRNAEGWVEVLEGLSEGETLVISAQFLIDSESNLRAAIEQLRAGSDYENHSK